MLCILFIHKKKHISAIRDLSFLLMLSCFISTNSYLGIFEALKWMKTTTEPKLFLAFLVFRNLFLPLLVSFFTIKIYTSSLKRKLVFIPLFSLITFSTEYLNLSSNLYKFMQWNYLWTILYYFIYLFCILTSLKWFRGLKEVKEPNDMDRKGIWSK